MNLVRLTHLHGHNMGKTFINLAWDPPAIDKTGSSNLEVYFTTTTPDVGYSYSYPPLTEATFSLANTSIALTPGTQYTFSTTAYNATETSPTVDFITSTDPLPIPTSITVSTLTLIYNLGDTLAMRALLLYSDFSQEWVSSNTFTTWTSSDLFVVNPSVSMNVLSYGTTTMTATYNDGVNPPVVGSLTITLVPMAYASIFSLPPDTRYLDNGGPDGAVQLNAFALKVGSRQVSSIGTRGWERLYYVYNTTGDYAIQTAPGPEQTMFDVDALYAANNDLSPTGETVFLTNDYNSGQSFDGTSNPGWAGIGTFTPGTSGLTGSAWPYTSFGTTFVYVQSLLTDFNGVRHTHNARLGLYSTPRVLHVVGSMPAFSYFDFTPVISVDFVQLDPLTITDLHLNVPFRVISASSILVFWEDWRYTELRGVDNVAIRFNISLDPADSFYSRQFPVQSPV